MEFVGKIVAKEFKGYGVFSGVIQSYDASSGFFEIAYEDGDSEELDFSEVASLLERKEADPAYHNQHIGRRPKKRRRVDPWKREHRGGGEESANFMSHTQANAQTLERQSSGVVEDNGKFDMNRNADFNDGFIGNLREVDRGNGRFGNTAVDLNEALEKGSGTVQTERERRSIIGSSNGNCSMKEAFDLNAGFSLNLNEALDLNEEDNINANILRNLNRRECIDLNLDATGDVNENTWEADLGISHAERQKKKCGFDLNFGIDDEVEDDADGECGGEAKESTSCEMVKEGTQKMNDASGGLERIHNQSAIANGALQEVHVKNDSYVRSAISGEDSRSGDSVEVHDAKTAKEDSAELVDGNRDYMKSANRKERGGRKRGRRISIANCLNSAPEATVFTDSTIIYADEGEIGSVYKERNDSQRRRGKLVDTSSSTLETAVIADADIAKKDCTVVSDGKQGDMFGAYKEVTGNCRKRTKFSDHVNSTPQMTVLRRSTRRGSTKNDISMTTASSVFHELSLSPAVSALTEERHVKSFHEWPEELVVLPPKVQLPPSSQNLDLFGLSIIDFFSVYTCLRSFSTLLFLSPFELEEFVAAMKCNSPSLLFDSIHVSILRTLRLHLEYLSNEGSESASICLRSLNWGLLDLNTWPVFMVDYFLIHGSDSKPCFNFGHLNLLKNEYYKQPVPVKIEILRCLCDDIIEVEAIRSEIDRRSWGAESDLDFVRNTGVGPVGAFKKRRAGTGMDISGSCLTEEAVDDTTDRNSDECCLCKMDGNLICCDGCPAAFHSKCVGVANDCLPEGDWFCPECAIDRRTPWMTPQTSVRGADLLGVDCHGRLYFSSCGYLLVSDSCETESSFNYYHRDDLNAVIEVLRSSEMGYRSILEAIQKHWDIPVNLYGASDNLESCLEMCMPQAGLASSETCTIKNDTNDERKPEQEFMTGFSAHVSSEVSKSLSQTCVSSEGSAETTQTSLQNQNFQQMGLNFSNRSADFLNESDIQGNFPSMGDNSLTSSSLDLEGKNVVGSAANGHLSSTLDLTNGNMSLVQLGTGYMNYYSYGHIASSIAEELMRKSSDKTIEDSIKTDEEIISAQMKIISKGTSKFCWSNIPRLNVGVHKEKCGWCFTCRVSSDELGCLLNMSLRPFQEGPVDEVGLPSKRKEKGHLTDIASHILFIEDRLQGLLLGPWLNPHYSMLWLESILKASDLVSVKQLLLILESNLHRLALSAEWFKHVDSATTMGSASHIVTSSLRTSSKNGIGRKRVRYSEFDSNPSSKSTGGLGMLWWRGGRLSRGLFSWKVLPRSLVYKAARQAGCVKIPGVLYPENSDFAKRSKYVSWRAAVQSSNTVEQLALQVRELDSNIKWDDIGNKNPLSMVDKEFKKSIRLFKKVIVRRKCIEGEVAKYLLDFGKRKIIPEIVIKNGSIVEESSSERKKYWLNESYVPLYLLKSFEEKRIARRSNKTSSEKPSDSGVVLKKLSKKRGFSYLFAKAERSEYHQCGHCNKDVPIRDSVCCQYCKGFFHKRHVRKSSGSVDTECMYTCHRCVDGKHMKTNSKMGKSHGRRGRKKKKNSTLQHQKTINASVSCRSVRVRNTKKAVKGPWSLRPRKKKKDAVVVPLRRSPRTAKCKSLQNKKVGGIKKDKQVKSKKATYKNPTNITSWRKKRTQTYHSYWINGLLLSRKADDERVVHFKSKSFLSPSRSSIHDQPKCHLCSEGGYTSTLNYVSCERCEEWFHGGAFGLDVEKSNKLIGFRCHICRKSTPPVCPQVPTGRCDAQYELSEEASNAVSQSERVQNDARNELSEEATKNGPHLSEMEQNVVQNEHSEEGINILQLSEINLFQDSLANEDHQGSLPVDESVCRKEHLGTTTTLDSGQSFAPGSRFEVDGGQLLDCVKEDTGATQISSKKLDSELILCNGNHMPKENTIESEEYVIVTSSDQMQTSSCIVDVDVIKTEVAPAGWDSERDRLNKPHLEVIS